MGAFKENKLFDLRTIKPLFPVPGFGAEFILETSLTLIEPSFDFSVCFRKAQVGELLDHWKAHEAALNFKDNGVWQNIRHFCQVWHQEGTPLNTTIADIWFEFDQEQMVKQVPEPCMFFSPRGIGYFPGPIQPVPDGAAFFASALGMLGGKVLPVGVQESIKQCIAALPPKGVVFQVGMMLSRNFSAPVIRFCISRPPHLYVPFLLRNQWPGPVDLLERLLQTIEPYVDAMFLDIDVGEQVAAPIGIECCYREGVSTERRIKSFLSFLTKEGLATSGQADWVMDSLRNNPVSEIVGSGLAEKHYQQALSHVKIILNPGHSLKAKAYLSFTPCD